MNSPFGLLQAAARRLRPSETPSIGQLFIDDAALLAVRLADDMHRRPIAVPRWCDQRFQNPGGEGKVVYVGSRIRD